MVSRVVEELWSRFPSASDLAIATVNDVEKIVAPLGFKKRAQTLVGCARVVEVAGSMKNSREWLLSLPGVGRYVADAVRTLAFDEPVVPIDAVIGRILRRVFGFPSYGPAYADKALWNACQVLGTVPNHRTVVMSLLDLGAMICTPANPNCSQCPLMDVCHYAKSSPLSSPQ